MSATKIDYDAIAKEIVEGHTTYKHYKTGEVTTSYEPIYWDQGFSETDDETLSLFVSGESTEDGFPLWLERADERLNEWYNDSVHHDAGELAETYVKDQGDDLDDDFDEYALKDEILERLWDACTQDYCREWVTRMQDPVVRIMLTDEDHPDSWVENDADWTPARLATNAGIEHTEKNLAACQVILDNAYYPGTVKMLYLVFRLDLDDVKDGTDTVRIKGEVELWATNPFQGDGMADTVDVDLTIPRERLATDKGAYGYSYVDVFGAHIPSIPAPELTFTKAETLTEAIVSADN